MFVAVLHNRLGCWYVRDAVARRLTQVKRTLCAARWLYRSERQEFAKGIDECAGALNVYLHCTFRGGQPKKTELGQSGAGLLGSPAPPLKRVARAARSFNFDSRKAPVSVQWFTGAETNLAFNCLDRHVEAGHGERVAFFWEGNDLGEDSTTTYSQLLAQVRSQTCFSGIIAKAGSVIGPQNRARVEGKAMR